jgi:hypothetical protein
MMQVHEVWPWLDEQGAALLCRDQLESPDAASGGRRVRVRVEHRPLSTVFDWAPGELDKLPRGEAGEQLRAVLEATGGVGLFAPKLWPLIRPGDEGWGHRAQRAIGSIIVWPPCEWARMHSEFMDWHYDGVEEAFKGLPYGPDDVLMFASINFSPNGWFIVRSGPMAGKIVFWTHDGDWQMDQVWAEDVKSWGERVRREMPGVLGGHAEFDSTAAADGEGNENLNLQMMGTLEPVGFEAGN